MYVGVYDINTILVRESGISALPSCDATAAGAERDGCGFHPEGTETVEEVGLPGHFAVLDVGIAQFADVDLEAWSVGWKNG